MSTTHVIQHWHWPVILFSRLNCTFLGYIHAVIINAIQIDSCPGNLTDTSAQTKSLLPYRWCYQQKKAPTVREWWKPELLGCVVVILQIVSLQECGHIPRLVKSPLKLCTGMSRYTGLRYTGIHGTPDIFRGSTPDRCFRLLYTGNSGFPIRYTPDISEAISVISCARKIFRRYPTCRFGLATSGKWNIHSTTQGIAAICMCRLSLYLIILVVYYANCFLCCFLLYFCFLNCNFLLFSILLFLFVILYCYFLLFLTCYLLFLIL